MDIERAPQKMEQRQDAGEAQRAAAASAAPQPVPEKEQELDYSPLESAIFDLRAKFRAGDRADALRAVDKVLAISGSHIEALRTGGRIGNLMRDENLALRYWERLGHAAPGDREAPLQAARIHLRRGQHAQALNWAAQAAKCRADATESLRIAVSAGLETGWTEACDPLLARLFAADRPRALKALSRLVQDLDCESLARVATSLQAQLAGDQEFADIVAKAYSRWLVAGREQELALRELAAAPYYRAARSVRPAEKNAQRALDRLSLPSLMAMRDAFNARDFASAVEHGMMVVRIDPDSFEAWQTVGRAQFTRGNTTEATNAFRRCTELKSKDAPSWLTFGLMLNQAGDRLAALTAFQKARELADLEVKREADATVTALHPLLVRDAQQAASDGDIELAWSFSSAALSIRPGDSDMLQLRRDLLRQQRQQVQRAWNAGSDSAADLCRRYLQKSPNDTYASTVLGRTLMRMRAYAEALPIWESLTLQAPEDSHNHLQIARCCRALKIRDRGLSAAETALRLDPKLQEAAKVADFLKTLPSSGGP